MGRIQVNPFPGINSRFGRFVLAVGKYTLFPLARLLAASPSDAAALTLAVPTQPAGAHTSPRLPEGPTKINQP